MAKKSSQRKRTKGAKNGKESKRVKKSQKKMAESDLEGASNGRKWAKAAKNVQKQPKVKDIRGSGCSEFVYAPIPASGGNTFG